MLTVPVLAALMASTGIVAVVVGPWGAPAPRVDASDKTIPSPRPDDTSPDETTPDETTGDEPTSIAELVALAGGVLGPIADLQAAIGTIAPVPAAVTMPANASIEAFRLVYGGDDHVPGDDGSYTAWFSLATAATADDLAAYYLATMASSGAALVDERPLDGAGDAARAGRELSFSPADADHSDTVVVIAVLDGDGPGGNGAIAEITVVDRLATDTIGALTSWIGALPFLATAEPAAATFAGRLDPPGGPAGDGGPAAVVVELTTTYEFDGVDADDLRDRLVADLPASGIDLLDDDVDAGEDADPVRLRHPYLRDLTAEFNAAGEDAASVTVSCSHRIDL